MHKWPSLLIIQIQKALMYKITRSKRVLLGRPTLDIARRMVTMGINEVFRDMEQKEIELRTLRRQIEILRGYLAEVVGPLDPNHPKETLNTILREGGSVQSDPFLKAC